MIFIPTYRLHPCTYRMLRSGRVSTVFNRIDVYRASEQANDAIVERTRIDRYPIDGVSRRDVPWCTWGTQGRTGVISASSFPRRGGTSTNSCPAAKRADLSHPRRAIRTRNAYTFPPLRIPCRRHDGYGGVASGRRISIPRIDGRCLSSCSSRSDRIARRLLRHPSEIQDARLPFDS